MDAFPRHQLLLQEDTHTPPSLRTHQCSCLEEWLVCRKRDRKSTRLNSSHLVISYAVFCLKKKNTVNIYIYIFFTIIDIITYCLKCLCLNMQRSTYIMSWSEYVIHLLKPQFICPTYTILHH